MNDGDRTNEASTDEMVDWYFPKKPGRGYPSPDEVGDPDKRHGLSLIVQKLNLLTVFSALVLFFLPWLDIRCSQESFATQSGVQTIYGGGSLAEGEKTLDKESESEIKGAPLVAVAFLAVVAAVLSAGLMLLSRRTPRVNWVGIFSALALSILAIQMVMGFPVERELKKDQVRLQTEDNSHKPSSLLDGFASAVLSEMEIRRMPAFYAVLALLGFPTLVSLNAWIDRLRSRVG